MEKIQNFIGGEFPQPASGKYRENFNPALDRAYSLVPDSDTRDVEQAVRAAHQAFPSWAARPAEERAALLRQLAQRIGAQAEELARAESIDNGKPLLAARSVDIPRSRHNFEFFADAITQFHGESYAMDDRALNYTTYSPLGVVACISPWNLPLYLLTWKIAPALAAGNTVVAKPSEITPMTAYLLSRLAATCLPPGVLNVVHGAGAETGMPLVTHSLVKAVSFTGSTQTGRLIAEKTAGSFKKLSLEMGGKNPTVVFADSDFSKAVEGSVRAAFSNQGQICLCGSRVLVEKSIYPKFRDAFVEKVRALRVGDPLDPETDQGAVVSRAHREKILSYLALGVQEGGKVLCGGRAAQLEGDLQKGYFIEPTVFEGLPSSSRLNQEEIFGPVACLVPFDDEKEALQIANSTRYGLAASIWTRDIARAQRVAKHLESGIVWVNTWMLRDLRTPFGGVKESGVGREGGHEALRFFSEVKNTCVGTV